MAVPPIVVPDIAPDTAKLVPVIAPAVSIVATLNPLPFVILKRPVILVVPTRQDPAVKDPYDANDVLKTAV